MPAAGGRASGAAARKGVKPMIEADAPAFTDLVCRFCGILYAAWHPSETEIHLPVCPQCVTAGREGCATVGEVASA